MWCMSLCTSICRKQLEVELTRRETRAQRCQLVLGKFFFPSITSRYWLKLWTTAVTVGQREKGELNVEHEDHDGGTTTQIVTVAGMKWWDSATRARGKGWRQRSNARRTEHHPGWWGCAPPSHPTLHFAWGGFFWYLRLPPTFCMEEGVFLDNISIP